MGDRGMGRVFQPMYKDKRGKWKRTETWWIAFYHNGRERRESSGSRNKNDARRLLRDKLSAMTTGTLITGQAQRLQFKDLVEKLYLDYRRNSRRSIDRVKDAVTHLEKYFGEFRATEITDEAIEGYVDQRLEIHGVANATVRYEISMLKRMFTLSRKFLPVRPNFPNLRLDNIRKGFFEESEFRKLLENLDEDLRPVMQFSYLTGWRIKSEILSLKWNVNVDLIAGEVRLEPGTTKNGEGRVFPFSVLPDLAEMLEQQQFRTKALEKATHQKIPWVFHRQGNKIHSFRGAWHAAVNAAEIPGKIPHDFRRTAVRNLERAGVPRSVAMKLVGHKTENVYRRYAIVAKQDLVDGLQRLANYRDRVETASKDRQSGDSSHPPENCQELIQTLNTQMPLPVLPITNPKLTENEKLKREQDRLARRYDRKKLYEQVWSQPVQQVAQSYGISNVRLGKVCRKLLIPVPPRGFWARLRSGYIAPQPSLPNLN
jgi:integrase